MTKETPDPTKETGLIFAPGFYYLAMWNGLCAPQVSKFNLGADWTAVVFRRMTPAPGEAADLWFIRYRFRHFKKSATDPFDGEDEFNWFGFEARGSEAIMIQTLDRLTARMAHTGMFNPSPVFWIKGDCEEFFRQVHINCPPWMHYQTEGIRE